MPDLTDIHHLKTTEMKNSSVVVNNNTDIIKSNFFIFLLFIFI